MKKATTSRFWHDTLLRIVKVANLGLVSLPFMVCWTLFYNKLLSPYPYGWRGLTILWVFYCALYFAFGKIYDAFQVALHRISEMI